MSKLTEKEVKKLNKKLIESTTPRTNKFIPYTPTEKQSAFLLLPVKEAFYGGAAGGGKSIALLMGGLQYLDVPGYSGILIRRSSKDLRQPGGLLSVAKDILMPFVNSGELRYNDKEMKFTNENTGGKPAYLQFGHLGNENDKFKYQGGEYQYIGFDELTQINEQNYKYLLSRLRRNTDVDIPTRVRAAANPGGIYHKWVKKRFVGKESDASKVFLPADITDNKHLDSEDYIDSLNELDNVTKERLLSGDWDIEVQSNTFNINNLRYTTSPPVKCDKVRAWDTAGTEPNEEMPDPDYTAGCLMVRKGEYYYIVDFRKFRKNPGETTNKMKKTAELDGTLVPICFEREPGSQGKLLIEYYKNQVFKKFRVKAKRTSGRNKLARATPFAEALENGQIYVVSGNYWVNDFIDELKAFGRTGLHDDMVDAAALAFNYLQSKKGNNSAQVVTVNKKSKWRGR